MAAVNNLLGSPENNKFRSAAEQPVCDRKVIDHMQEEEKKEDSDEDSDNLEFQLV